MCAVCKLEGWKRVKWPRSKRPKPGVPDKGYSGRREGGCAIAGRRPGRSGPTRPGVGWRYRYVPVYANSGLGGSGEGLQALIRGTCTKRLRRGAWRNKNKGTAIITITSVILQASLARRSTAKRNHPRGPMTGPALRICTKCSIAPPPRGPDDGDSLDEPRQMPPGQGFFAPPSSNHQPRRISSVRWSRQPAAVIGPAAAAQHGLVGWRPVARIDLPWLNGRVWHRDPARVLMSRRDCTTGVSAMAPGKGTSTVACLLSLCSLFPYFLILDKLPAPVGAGWNAVKQSTRRSHKRLLSSSILSCRRSAGGPA
ncbi:hypothetical protein V8C35DRAFT_1039 [Trichoderma chlorosporum]